MSLQIAPAKRYPGVEWDRSPPGSFPDGVDRARCHRCATASELVRHCTGERPQEFCWMRLEGEHAHYRCTSKTCNAEWPVRGGPAK